MIRKAFDLTARFARARDGSIAIIFAAVLIPVIGITSAAIDFGRAAKVRSTLLMATSAAAQAASARLLEDSDVVEQEAKRLLLANLPAELKSLPYKVQIAADRSFVEVAMETSVRTTLMGILGVSELGVEATGYARAPIAVAKSGETGVAGAAGGGIDEARAILSRGLGGAGPAGGFGGTPLEIGGVGQIKSEADLKAAAQAIADQVREIRSQIGSSGGAGGLGGADIERVMREMRRSMR